MTGGGEFGRGGGGRRRACSRRPIAPLSTRRVSHSRMSPSEVPAASMCVRCGCAATQSSCGARWSAVPTAATSWAVATAARTSYSCSCEPAPTIVLGCWQQTSRSDVSCVGSSRVRRPSWTSSSASEPSSLAAASWCVSASKHTPWTALWRCASARSRHLGVSAQPPSTEKHDTPPAPEPVKSRVGTPGALPTAISSTQPSCGAVARGSSSASSGSSIIDTSAPPSSRVNAVVQSATMFSASSHEPAASTPCSSTGSGSQCVAHCLRPRARVCFVGGRACSSPSRSRSSSSRVAIFSVGRSRHGAEPGRGASMHRAVHTCALP